MANLSGQAIGRVSVATQGEEVEKDGNSSKRFPSKNTTDHRTVDQFNVNDEGRRTKDEVLLALGSSSSNRLATSKRKDVWLI